MAFSFVDGSDERGARGQVTEAPGQVTMPFDDSREAYAACLGTVHLDVTLDSELNDATYCPLRPNWLEAGPFHVEERLLIIDGRRSEGRRCCRCTEWEA